MINFVIEHCSINDLDKLYQIIKGINIEYKQSSKLQIEIDEEEDEDIDLDYKSFNNISDESISYIIGFLDWRDIINLNW